MTVPRRGWVMGHVPSSVPPQRAGLTGRTESAVYAGRSNGRPAPLSSPVDLDGANCRGADPDLFFGPSAPETRKERMEREAAAKALCRACPALAPCRTYAMAQAELYGVWGGMSEQERRTQLARAGRLSAHL
jgi:WhiB family transcriptional regulator, redox-sensing transcriptional regulator